MAPAASPSSQSLDARYRAVVQEACKGAGLLMGKLVASARQTLHAREGASRDLRERDALAESAKQLRNWEPELCKRLPDLLSAAFENPDVLKKAQSLDAVGLQFDQLELMDEAQVLSSVTLAKMQQTVSLVVESSLADLNTLMCGALGMGAVRAESNPLRPEIYIHALKEAVASTRAPSQVQFDWLGSMGTPLGQELRNFYTAMSAGLRSQGVKPAAYAVAFNPASVGRVRVLHQESLQQTATVPPATRVAADSQRQTGSAPATPPTESVRMGAQNEALLTLDRLRRLLVGELDGAVVPANRKEAFAQEFARQFEGGRSSESEVQTDFDATVPAALEALTEMKQVDRVVQSLQHRRTAGAKSTEGSSIEAVRSVLRRDAANVAQVLSLEVVTLMVDNIARDPRLLAPVRQWVRRLEPALLRLALGDPRFFTDKQHPARLLVQEVAHRSLGFASLEAHGLDAFLRDIEAAVVPLDKATAPHAEMFAQGLEALRVSWATADAQQRAQRDQAVHALQHAEARHVLAAKIAREIEAHPDSRSVPDVVIDFLCGPWAQVVAQARIAGGAGSSLADKYQALISAMLWSAHPDLAPRNIAKLTRLVPVLLNTLREGLETIHYPSTKTSVFLEALMGLHQRAFQRASKSERAVDASGLQSAAPSVSTGQDARVQRFDEGDPWVAPGEAQQSNLMELEDASGEVADALTQAKGVLQELARAAEISVENLPLGSWVELCTHGKWSRTQLTWASPHGTLFLFTSVYGDTQSMSRRVRDKLIETGNLRLLSGQPVVEVALDAVAEAAMRNSMDTQG